MATPLGYIISAQASFKGGINDTIIDLLVHLAVDC